MWKLLCTVGVVMALWAFIPDVHISQALRLICALGIFSQGLFLRWLENYLRKEGDINC